MAAQVFGDVTNGMANAANMAGEQECIICCFFCEARSAKSLCFLACLEHKLSGVHVSAALEDGMQQTTLAVKDGKAVLEPCSVSSFTALSP